MGWHSVTHGTNGLILADRVTLIALVVTLVKKRARATLLVIALPCVLLGGIAAGVLGYVIAPRGAGESWTRVSGKHGQAAAAGVGGGVLMVRRRTLGEIHKRGTVIGNGHSRSAGGGRPGLSDVRVVGQIPQWMD